MKVKVTKEFPWAPDGNHVRHVQPGEVLEGRGAEVALAMNSGEVVAEVPVPALVPPSTAPQADDGACEAPSPQEPAAAPPPSAAAEEPAPEQKTSSPGFSTADIGRKKRHGR